MKLLKILGYMLYDILFYSFIFCIALTIFVVGTPLFIIICQSFAGIAFLPLVGSIICFIFGSLLAISIIYEWISGIVRKVNK